MNGIKIGSFNVANLSRTGKDRLDNIAKIIIDNNLDIVAMQEVLGEGNILTGSNSKSVSGQAAAADYSLKMRLGSKWDICWRDPETSAKSYPFIGGDSRGEGYAYLWNSDRVELPLDENGNKVFPRIWRNYKTNVEEDMMRLIREPCYGRFVIKNTSVEIRLITTHIIFGKPSSDNMSEEFRNLDIGAVNMRRNEFKILAGQIYPRINENYKDIKYRSAYTILLGDYNLNLSESGKTTATVKDAICFDERGKEISGDAGFCKVYTVQNELSTINKENTDLANNYDHFSYDDRVMSCVSREGARTIKAVDDLFGTAEDKYERYKKEVSDHLPIIVELEF